MQYGLFTVELAEEEIALVEAMSFDPLAFPGNRKAFVANGELALRLTRKLVERGAIPEHRLRYFTDPDYYHGGHGKSRKDVFESNGTSGDDIIRHGSFLKYLRYFVNGAELPHSAMQSFKSAVVDCDSITSGDVSTLSTTACQLTRIHGLTPKETAEEFFKLCLDLGIDMSYASVIRSSVQQLKSKY